MPMTHDSDLEAFKTAIDLRVYAAGLGYSLDRRESWRGSSVLRHGNADKLMSSATMTSTTFIFPCEMKKTTAPS